MLLVASAATFFTSCDDVDDDITGTFDGDKYYGTFTVTMPAMYGGATTDPSEATFYFDTENDMATVSMAEICFTASMDMGVTMPALDIIMPNIPMVSEGVYESASVTPTMTDGQPYDDTIIKSITDVSVVDSELSTADMLTVSFDCTVEIDMMGTGTATPITFTINYTGYEI